MVATVNAGVRTDLITYSDLMWQLALQPNTVLDNPNLSRSQSCPAPVDRPAPDPSGSGKDPDHRSDPKEVSDAGNELARQFASHPSFSNASFASV